MMPSLLVRLTSRRRLYRRETLEDALKHVFHQNERDGFATIQSLAGALALGPGDASALAVRMEHAGLIRSSGEGLALTPEGREYAIRVIRAHRLWERYLADRTGAAEMTWHHDAERREHELTPGEADALSARLGHPRYDPHGDPIPTTDGEMPAPSGVSLRDLSAGASGRIVHIEDEPASDYAAIVAAGIHAGAMIRVLRSTPEEVVVWTDGEERALTPLLATHIAIAALDGEPWAGDAPASSPLSDLEPGEGAEILYISRACRGLERRRLMDLGVVPGTLVSVLMRSPTGDPTAYRLRDTTIAIRRDQARHVRVRRAEEAAA